MKLAIMQPYFLPYLGYFQLVNAVDEFVIYDNIQFSKGGWFHRNRILVNGTDSMFTIPLKKGSDYLDVRERELADSYDEEAQKILRRIEASYRKAPYFKEVMPLVQECFRRGSGNLFDFIFTSLKLVLQYLDIRTQIIVSSSVAMDHTLKAQDKVLAFCKSLKADTYINAIGGQDLYTAEAFKAAGLELRFIKMLPIEYVQLGHPFAPHLSIIDVLMFNSRETIQDFIQHQYTLIE